MPLPQGFGTLMPVPVSVPTPSAPGPAPSQPPSFPTPPPTQPVVGTDRARLERERWDRMDVLYQNIRNNARQFEYPAASVAALESVLVRMYFESPLPQPAYAAATLPLVQVPPLQQAGDVAMGRGGQSGGSQSDEDEDEDDEDDE
jgi:hypothetical protein